MENYLLTYPSVYAIENEYQIMFIAKCQVLAWVEINGMKFFDESNGVICSAEALHKVTVPVKLLDESKKYTLCLRKVNQRRAYRSDVCEPVSFEFDFRPVQGETIRIYNIADAHNKVETPIKAAGYFKDIDLLILNGDIPNDSSDVKNFYAIHEITGRITKGNIPAVFVRGNHDLRGIYAEKMADYIPNRNGKTYYTFRISNLWGLVLDCGEDKPDSHPEYGNTVCCEFFRMQETAFFENVIKNADTEYLAPGVEKRIVICHVPFTETYNPPFDIEQDTYGYWCKLLREEVKPQLMFCAHNHQTQVNYPGGSRDHKGQACPVIHGGDPCFKLLNEGIDKYIGAGIVFGSDTVEVSFNDNEGNDCGGEKFNLKA